MISKESSPSITMLLIVSNVVTMLFVVYLITCWTIPGYYKISHAVGGSCNAVRLMFVYDADSVEKDSKQEDKDDSVSSIEVIHTVGDQGMGTQLPTSPESPTSPTPLLLHYPTNNDRGGRIRHGPLSAIELDLRSAIELDVPSIELDDMVTAEVASEADVMVTVEVASFEVHQAHTTALLVAVPTVEAVMTPVEAVATATNEPRQEINSVFKGAHALTKTEVDLACKEK